MQKLSISQLGKKVGLSPKTIRFYEESGVIASPLREANGYRSYDDSTVETLLLIKNARDLGLPISEIKKLMVGCDAELSCHHTKQYIETQVSEYLSVLEAKIAQFTTLKQKLESLQTKVENNCEDGAYCCNILYQLSDRGQEKGGEKNMNENCTCCGQKCNCGENCKC
jgi:MerR family transcriptional regulator, copper efflux regulator